MSNDHDLHQVVHTIYRKRLQRNNFWFGTSRFLGNVLTSGAAAQCLLWLTYAIPAVSWWIIASIAYIAWLAWWVVREVRERRAYHADPPLEDEIDDTVDELRHLQAHHTAFVSRCDMRVATWWLLRAVDGIGAVAFGSNIARDTGHSSYGIVATMGLLGLRVTTSVVHTLVLRSTVATLLFTYPDNPTTPPSIKENIPMPARLSDDDARLARTAQSKAFIAVMDVAAHPERQDAMLPVLQQVALRCVASGGVEYDAFRMTLIRIIWTQAGVSSIAPPEATEQALRGLAAYAAATKARMTGFLDTAPEEVRDAVAAVLTTAMSGTASAAASGLTRADFVKAMNYPADGEPATITALVVAAVLATRVAWGMSVTNDVAIAWATSANGLTTRWDMTALLDSVIRED